MKEQKKPVKRNEQIANIKNLEDKAKGYRWYSGESNFTSVLNNLYQYHTKVQNTINDIEEKYEKLGGKDIHTNTIDKDGNEVDYDEEIDYRRLKKFVRDNIFKDRMTQRNRLKREYRHLAQIWHEVDEFLKQDYQEKEHTEENQKETFVEDIKFQLQKTDADPEDVPLKKEAKKLLAEMKKYYKTREDARTTAVFATSNVIETVLTVPTTEETAEDNVNPTEPTVEEESSTTTETTPALETPTSETGTSAEPVIIPEETTSEVLSRPTPKVEMPTVATSATESKAKETTIHHEELRRIKKSLRDLSANLVPDKVVARILKIDFAKNNVSYLDQYGKMHIIEYIYDIKEKDNTTAYIESEEYIKTCENFQGLENKKKFSKLLTKVIHERKGQDIVKEQIKSIDDIKKITTITQPIVGTFRIDFVNKEDKPQFIKITFRDGEPANEVDKMKELVAISQIFPLSDIQLESEEYLNKKVELGKKLQEAQNEYEKQNKERVLNIKMTLQNDFGSKINNLPTEAKNNIQPILDLVGSVSSDNFMPTNLEELFVLDFEKLNFATDQEAITYVDNLVKDTSDILSMLNHQLLAIQEIKKVVKGSPIVEDLEKSITKNYFIIKDKNKELQEELAYSREAYSTHVLGGYEVLEDPIDWISKLAIHQKDYLPTYEKIRDFRYIKDSHKKINEQIVKKFTAEGIKPFEREYTYSPKVIDNIDSLVGKEGIISGSVLTQEEANQYREIAKIPELTKEQKKLKKKITKLVFKALDISNWSQADMNEIPPLIKGLIGKKLLEDEKELTEKEIKEYTEIAKIPELTEEQEKLRTKVQMSLKEVIRLRKNPKTPEEWLTKAKQQLEALRLGNEAETKVFEAVSKQVGVFGVLELPKWSQADMEGVDCLTLTAKVPPTEKDSMRIVELLSKSAMLSYKGSLEAIINKDSILSNSDKIRRIQKLSQEEKKKKYLDDPKEQIKFYQQGQQTNKESLESLEKNINNNINSKEENELEITELNLMLIKYGIDFVPCQIKNIIGKPIRSKEVTESNNNNPKSKARPLIIGYNPLDIRDSPYLKPTAIRPENLPAINPQLEKEPDIPYSVDLETSIAMALQLGDPASIYNTPGINTGNRFNAKDIDLPNIDDSQELYNIEPKRDLIANVQKILTK